MRSAKLASLRYVALLIFILVAFAMPHAQNSSRVLNSGGSANPQVIRRLFPPASIFTSSDPRSSGIKNSIRRTTETTSQTSDRLKGSWVWLWQNYSGGLQAIQEHAEALTVVSPNTYFLFDNATLGIQSVEAEVCPQVHAMGLQCIPAIQNDQTNPMGINTLLSSTALQSTFIQNAVNTAVNSELDGYNVDFEPSSGIQNLASQYGTFLTNFANAMHAVGKTLSVDVATWDSGALWNYAVEAKSSVDLVVTMVTYDADYSTFQSGLQAMLASVPLEKIAIGLMTSADDGTLAARFQAIEANNISCVMVWPSNPGFLTQIYWDNLASFVQS